MTATGESLDREKSGQEMFPAGKCLRPGNVRPGKDWRGNVINREKSGEGRSGWGKSDRERRRYRLKFHLSLPPLSRAKFFGGKI